ncbi:restriction endonuclease subunit S [Brevibacterium sp. H602]|uniref:restriction endonuclease subunit S n=1 Tax=Brevibacterium sp. H602 TaxID=3444316 RepID=UPI003EBA64A5
MGSRLLSQNGKKLALNEKLRRQEWLKSLRKPALAALMSEWPTAAVGTHVTQRVDKVAISPGSEYDTMGVRWYGKGAYLRPPSRPKTTKLNVAHEGDFVFCRIDVQNGPFAVVPPDLDGALVTNEFPLYAVDGDVLDAQFLALCFASQGALDQIGKKRDGRDGRARWKEHDFEAWRIPLPPLDVQGRTVEVMGAVDATVTALEAEVSAARTARAALVDQLLVDLGEEVTDYVMDDVADWTSGGTPKADNPAFYSGEIPWAIIGDVRGRYVGETTRRITKAGLDAIGGERKLVQPGAVLVTMYGTIGRSAITTVPTATNQAIARGVPNELVTAEYLRLWISAREADLVKLGEGKTQQNISKAKILQFPIKVPKPESQKRVVDIMTTVDDQIDSLERELASMAGARAALLDSLLTREIEVVLPGSDEVDEEEITQGLPTDRWLG